MHVHIATVGKVPEPVMKTFKALGYDKLYLLHSRNFKETADDIRSTLTRFNTAVELVEISGFDFQEIVNSIYKIYEAEHGRDVTFSINITGGTNLMAAAACSCAFFIGATIYYVLWDDNLPVSGQVIQISTPKTPNLESIGKVTRKVFGFIFEEREKGHIVTNASIAEGFDATKQMIGYHLRILESEELIISQKGVDEDAKVDRRRCSIDLTQQGRLIASWLK